MGNPYTDFFKTFSARILRILRRKKGKKKGQMFSDAEAEEVKKALAAGEWPFETKGFAKVRFSTTANSALERIQQDMVHALFARIGLAWIPGEYKEILKTNQNPVKAMEVFLKQLGIPVLEVREQKPAALAQLHQCVGILLEFQELKDLVGDKEKTALFDAFSARNYDKAEEILHAIKLLVVLREEYVSELKREVVFPAYHSMMAEVLALTFDKLTVSMMDEIQEARRVFLEAHKRYVDLLWLQTELATAYETIMDTDWGKENVGTLKFLATKIEEHLKALCEQNLFVAQHLDALEALAEKVVQFMILFEQETGASGSGPTAGNFVSPEEQAKLDLVELGFKPTDTITLAQLKKAYRKLAMKKHPDVCKDPDADVQFKKLNEAFDRLEIYLKKNTP